MLLDWYRDDEVEENRLVLLVKTLLEFGNICEDRKVVEDDWLSLVCPNSKPAAI